MNRNEVARVLGLPLDRVRILATAAGGGFGSKLDVTLQPLIGLVALKTGRPARMVFSRMESMIASTKRHPGRLRATLAADQDGRVTALEFDAEFDTGAYASWGPTVANRVPVHATGPYRTPAVRARARAIHTNGPVAGAFRGFGVPQATILQEALYDALADRIGFDRLAFRRRNALLDGDETATGQRLDSVGIADCLDALAPHWARALATARAANARDARGPIRHGVGVASCWYGCGNTALPNPSTIRLGLDRAGRLRLWQGAPDIGQGSNTVIAQIAAQAFGLPLDHVDLVGPDTAVTPDAGKTSASRQTVVTGRAAQAAAEDLRAQILRRANLGPDAAFSVEPGDAGATLVLRDGRAERRLALIEEPADADGLVFRAEARFDPPTTPLDADGQGAPYAVYGYGAQIAEVAVDTMLGATRVKRVTAAHDVGRAINPTLAAGQIEGGIAQGLGMALMEDYVAGRTENLHDYLIPTSGDAPEITTILVEKPDPQGPFGARGLGEHALIPTAPAILNAIAHATGARVTRLPAAPDRLLAAIDDAKRGGA